MEKEISLSQWLETHHERFCTFTPYEIADIAIASGYPELEVQTWLTQTKYGRRLA